MLLQSMELECEGNRVRSGERLVRTHKVVNRKESIGKGEGKTMEADILSEDARSNAPGDGWPAWIRMAPYDADCRDRAVKKVRRLKVYQNLVKHSTPRQESVVKMEPCPRAILVQASHEIIDHLRACRPRRASLFMQAECACPDYDTTWCKPWCKHITALGFLLVIAAETRPTAFLNSMGVSLVEMIEEDVAKKRDEEAASAASGATPTTSQPAKRHRHANSAQHPIVLE